MDNGFHTLDCLQELQAGESLLMSVFNPNVKSLHGLFLTVERHLSNLKTSVLTRDKLSKKEVSDDELR